MDDDVNVVGIHRGPETYLVLYTDAEARAAIHAVGLWADQPDLSFNWYDAAILSGKIRESKQSVRRW